ncbi:MAG: UPF0280 family protein [Planctomycetes bacterium]|jgi:hypothetical protein|nr:UPF0280 family protein [Planctomycetota bacterium]
MPEPRRRIYRTFTHHEAVLRICCDQFDAVAGEIVRQRRILEEYLARHPQFQSTLEPIELLTEAPEIARHMAWAARRAGVGPMAAVAGAMAQRAAEAALAAGAPEAIVDNGGDIYLKAAAPVVVALGTGTADLADRLAFSIGPEETPLAICSSSGKMGHSMSFGQCDLATIVAKDAALADAAATQAANFVKTVDDVDAALERILGIEGITGVLLVKDDRIGLAGHLPQLIKTQP